MICCMTDRKPKLTEHPSSSSGYLYLQLITTYQTAIYDRTLFQMKCVTPMTLEAMNIECSSSDIQPGVMNVWEGGTHGM